ncbi:short-chain specific acyl-CoA dehydrogenase, mitochondrial [Caerostris extrusa]|uniref:Short-chain specific acyl-CoA dehydrogenase, mitochondrial n=1 Tax=Caerostris extrusa TaxID=172846 RepID=A0AAV4PIZ7_CAEEX|nr:short-chain specific acyl-CoA dehydrogenase, mitochondrial [Caerostris extrusa]
MNKLLTIFRDRSSTYCLPETHKILQDTCRKFSDEQLKPMAGKIDKEHLFPEEQIKQIGALGLFGLTVSENEGGAGLDNLAYVTAMEEISRGCASCGTIMSVHCSLYISALQNFGNDEQKREFLNPFITGEKELDASL